jgi:hypothetical protein
LQPHISKNITITRLHFNFIAHFYLLDALPKLGAIAQ